MNTLNSTMPARIDPEGKKLTHLRDFIQESECTAAGTDPAYGGAGVWDEYFSFNQYLNTPDGAFLPVRDDNALFPDRIRWLAVFVVTGGSEGTYLHVDALIEDDRRKTVRKNLFLGKTCSYSAETWAKCYESAARIAWMLGA